MPSSPQAEAIIDEGQHEEALMTEAVDLTQGEGEGDNA